MRYTRAIGLIAVAAAAMMALVGTSSAMAESTQVCTTHQFPCPTSITSDTLHLRSGEILLLHGLSSDGSQVNILCLSSLMQVDYGALGRPQAVTILSWTAGSCGTEGSGGSHSNCTVTVLGLPYSATLLKLTLNTGHLEITDADARVHKKCTVFGFIKIECEYSYSGFSFAADGALEGNNGLVLPEGVVTPLVSGGSLCPEEHEITLGTFEALTKGYLEL